MRDLSINDKLKDLINLLIKNIYEIQKRAKINKTNTNEYAELHNRISRAIVIKDDWLRDQVVEIFRFNRFKH